MIYRIRKKNRRFPRTLQKKSFTLLLGFLVLCLVIPTTLTPSTDYNVDSNSDFPQLDENGVVSSVGSTGNDINSVMIYSRKFQAQDIDIMNSYSDTSSHSTSIDLSSYQIPGWTLYEVQIDADTITAIAEREVLGVSADHDFFKIEEYSDTNNWTYNSLTQGFYEMPHDGKLLNYSFYYDSPIYNPAQHGWAYYSVLSDYQNYSSNMVGYTQLPTRVLLGAGWEDVTVSSVILSADKEYFTVINGSALIESVSTSLYPDIRWHAEFAAGTFITEQYDSRFSLWADFPSEALLNYTYTPWNITADAASVYSDPGAIDLKISGTPVSGPTWTVNSASNITSLQFVTNQSISIDYDLTLKYRKDVVSTAQWFAETSGANIGWNITSILDFPELSGSQDRNLTMDIPDDWTANHLFNITTPTQYYDHFNQTGISVECSLLADETWVLECSSPNYLKSISKFDASDDSVIMDEVSVAVTMDINSTIESLLSAPALNGEASLRIYYQSTEEYTENFTVTSGKSYHQWDISVDSSSNGLHIIDIFWMNGTEVGYRTTSVLVYYETTLVADEYSIDDFTDDSFYIGIDFNQVFPVGGIDASGAEVTYSFGSIVNQSLTDRSNGRWDATVLTTSMSPGPYTLTIYAEGYALENRSITIDVNLIHDTLPLTIIYSNISFVETTELSVAYERVGNIPIPNALVEVTIGTTTWQLEFNGSIYKMVFNGTDSDPGFGSHKLTIEASRTGYESQSDDTKTLDIHIESTSFDIEWSRSTNITYVESVILYVDYQMSNTTPIYPATVEVTINTDVFEMNWNGGSGRYWLQFDGNDPLLGIGIHSLTIAASKFGYQNYTNSLQKLNISEEPTQLVLSWTNTNSITYVTSTTLIANYTQSSGVPVVNAIVNVSVGFGPWSMNWNPVTFVYQLTFNGTDSIPGFGTFDVTVLAGSAGFVHRSNTTEDLIVDLESTSIDITWSNTGSITYFDQTTLIVSYRMHNYTVIPIDAIVNVTIDGFPSWDLNWDEGTETYRLVFNGSDISPGFGSHDLTIRIGKYGYENHENSTLTLTISRIQTNMIIAWFDSSTISYLDSTILDVRYQMSNGTPIIEATVIATIDSLLYVLAWNPIFETYRYTFNGADSQPGIGNHNLIINANKTGFDSKSDNGEYLRINEESTFINITWSNNNTITFVESTILIVNYTMNNGSPVVGATVNATIEGFPTWDLNWDNDTQTYRLTFNGTDVPPGLGFHNITISGDKFGYESRVYLTNITLDREQTYLIVNWIPDNDITYLTSSILIVSYRMKDSTPISGAIVNVTYGTAFWPLKWSSANQDYRLQINGSDLAPGFGNFTLNIQASMSGFYEAENLTQWVLIREEPTDLNVRWANGDNSPNFHSYTYLIADYLYDGSIPIENAILNVSINSYTFDMEWNGTEQYYQLRINGSDSYLGIGNNNITVLAGKPYFENKLNSSEEVVIPVIPTKLVLVWIPNDTITYVEYATLQAYYTMYNDTWFEGASVNVTINGKTLQMTWSLSSHSYERTFYGSDSTLGINSFSILVEASMVEFQSQSNSDEVLSIQLEPTDLVISWIGGDRITYFNQTTLSVQFRMSNTTPISTGTLNASINGSLYVLEWNGSNAYEVVIYGNDTRLGLDTTFTVVINASSYGYIPAVDSLETLRIRVEDTYLTFEWIPSNTMTYVGQTTLEISYLRVSNDAWIEDAIVIVTIYELVTVTMNSTWNNDTKVYEITFYGNDDRFRFITNTLYINVTKTNYQSHLDSSQNLSKTKEPTSVTFSWSNTNDITYSESTMLYVNFTMSNGTEIPYAGFSRVEIGSDNWDLLWDSDLRLYKVNFTESSAWPGLGVHGLTIRFIHTGYVSILDESQVLTISGELGSINSYWLGDGIITFVESDTLVVNYTIADGTPISGATVNVTIDGHLWDLVWHPGSETYRLVFNGTDNPPGLGFHNLDILAWRLGFDGLPDSSLKLNITVDPTTLEVSWSNSNSITYFTHTYLFVRYLMNDSSDILGASVNVTIGTTTWNLQWNGTQGAYGVLFQGWDTPPGLGSHSILINATKYGFAYCENNTETLTLLKDPTTIYTSWTNGNEITYVGSTTLIVQYRMSNNTPISTGTVTATIGTDVWILDWNVSAQVYYVVFDGDMNPPGLGFFTIDIDASATIFAIQSTTESLTIEEEPTSATASWSTGTATIDWTEDIILGIDYRDTFGRLIEDATQKSITIDGSIYSLQGTNGTYWFEFDNSFDLGHHIVVVNISKYGYEFAVNTSISFDIVNANTDISLVWDFTTIDYLGQIILTADYIYSGTGGSIPFGLVEANITIDGITTLSLTPSSDNWTITLDGVDLDLGSHSVVVLAQAYGYNFAEKSETLIVNEVSTISSGFSWTPSNLTIEYTDSLNLVVDYTYAGGDVPATAIVNVSIEGRLYVLSYSAGAWRVSIPGSDLGIGIYDADISAWLYGYNQWTHVTSGINVTLAANSFIVTWEPWTLTPTYIDTVNLSVIYTEDFSPILDSSVRLYINGSAYDLTYNPIDEKWHFSIDAASIDLGIWNITVIANKTGYTEGYYTDILVVVVVPTTLSIVDTGTTFYYDENTTLDIYYQLANLSTVPSAVISFTLNSVEQDMNWTGNHWHTTLNGATLGVGVHTFNIETSVYGYETQTDTIDITVQSIPTSLIVDAGVVIFARESVSFRFTYYDDRSSTTILASNFDIFWNEFYDIVTLPNNTYLVTVGGDDFHVGNYTFQFTLERLGFDNNTGVIDIDVFPIPTQFVYETLYSQYENETILIKVQLLDAVQSTSIDWAMVTIDLEGVGYVAIYNSSDSTYEVRFRLPLNLAPGSYSMYLHAAAEDCIPAVEITGLTVLAKSEYVLTINGPEEAQEENDIPITVTVIEDDQPVQGVYLSFTIIVHLINDEPQIIVEAVFTDSSGIAEVILTIPSNAIEIEASASFQGSLSEWPADSNSITIDVVPAGSGGWSLVIPDPITLSIIIGGISLPLLAIVFIRKRRGGSKVSASVSVRTPPHTPPVPPDGGIHQRLMSEIMNSGEGITRAELSRRLGPSASKIGAMVKDLLNSDSGFYEVREGAKKLIRYKNPE